MIGRENLFIYIMPMTLLSKIFILFNTEEWQVRKMQRKKFY